MKKIIAVAVALMTAPFSHGQDKTIATEQYKVSGLCGHCKERIEDAAYVKGVKKAEWNKKTGMLTVVYRSDKTSAKEILDHIAAAGHDNEMAKAADSVYDQLPQCCHYRDSKD